VTEPGPKAGATGMQADPARDGADRDDEARVVWKHNFGMSPNEKDLAGSVGTGQGSVT